MKPQTAGHCCRQVGVASGRHNLAYALWRPTLAPGLFGEQQRAEGVERGQRLAAVEAGAKLPPPPQRLRRRARRRSARAQPRYRCFRTSYPSCRRCPFPRSCGCCGRRRSSSDVAAATGERRSQDTTRCQLSAAWQLCISPSSRAIRPQICQFNYCAGFWAFP